MKVLKLFLMVFTVGLLLFNTLSCHTSKLTNEKINGVSFVASNDTISYKHIKPVKAVNANWTSIMPYGIMRAKDNPELFYNTERHWYGERYEGTKQSIEQMHKNGLKVMLKPQIWIVNGTFTGEIDMQTEEDWKTLESNYQKMMLLYAKLAQETNTEMYCIGTELNGFISARPEFWQTLITKVRAIYKGKLTYAENWDKINNVPFWEKLDNIGVDAYFPISEAKTPPLKEVKKKWTIINKQLEELSEKTKTPILFTEFGYRSVNYSGLKPWDASTIEGQVNQDAQYVLLQGLMESIWDKDWFAGGFLWKWFHNPEKISPRYDNRFCVHNKKAEKFLKIFYAKY